MTKKKAVLGVIVIFIAHIATWIAAGLSPSFSGTELGLSIYAVLLGIASLAGGVLTYIAWDELK